MTILIVDGNNLTARANFAGKDLTKEDGTPTGCTYISIKSFKFLVEKFKPDSVLVCWDKGRSRYRTSIYPEYKSNRNHDNDTLEEKLEYENYIDQINRVKNYLTGLPIQQFDYPGCEADDLIAFIVEKYISEGRAEEVVLVSNDTDFYQLIVKGVKIYDPIKKLDLDSAYIKKKFEISADKYVYFKCMLGDKTDGISGIKGYGAAAAKQVLDRLDKVEELSDLKTVALAEDLQKKKKFRDFVENFEVVERNYQLINLLNRGSFLSMDIKNDILFRLENSTHNIDHQKIFMMSYEDEFSSIYKDRTLFLKPFYDLLNRRSKTL